MGTGKTIGVLNAWHPNDENLYVVAPAPVTAQWSSEAQRMYPGIDVDLIETTTQRPRGAPITVFSYTALGTSTNLMPDLLRAARGARRPTIVACDEAHKLKTPGTRQTRAVYGWKDKDCLRMIASAVWPLSGKFAPKDVGDLWTHIAALFPGMFGGVRAPTYDEFLEKFCVFAHTNNVYTHGIKIVGGKNEAFLAEKMRPYFSRITLDEAAPYLPNIMVDTYTLPISAVVRRQLKDLHADHNAVAAMIEQSETASDVFAIMEEQEHVQKSLRRMLGEIKAPLVAAKAIEDFEGGADRIIIFGWHRTVLVEIANLLNAHGIPTETIMGGISQAQRNTIKRNFALEQTRCLCVNLKAGGEGVDGLQVANRILFVESSTVPGDNEQAIRRIRRIGQTRTQQVFFCTVPSPLDTAIMATAARRARSIARMEEGLTL
jgi:SNF2 family DNA or RNA helicase